MINIIELYALNNIKGIGPKAILKILDVLKSKKLNSIQNIDVDILLESGDLNRYKKIIKQELGIDVFKSHMEIADKEIKIIKDKKIEIIGINESRYPSLLRLIKEPPVLLYCIGNIELLNNSKNVAVVGTRNNTELGARITQKTVDFLCENEFTIVSGLAKGVDTIAHKQSLTHAKGKTIAVLVDVENIQPKSNAKLAENIVERGGLLVSEVSPRTPIIPQQFVKRDRIQSGMSLAVFAIETDVNGGTRHAVMNANQENRMVYVPDTSKSGYSDINIPQLSGIRKFIADNTATPYTKHNYESILNELENALNKEQIETDVVV